MKDVVFPILFLICCWSFFLFVALVANTCSADTSFSKKELRIDKAGRIWNNKIEILMWKMSHRSWKEHQARKPQMPERLRRRLRSIPPARFYGDQPWWRRRR